MEELGVIALRAMPQFRPVGHVAADRGRVGCLIATYTPDGICFRRV